MTISFIPRVRLVSIKPVQSGLRFMADENKNLRVQSIRFGLESLYSPLQQFNDVKIVFLFKNGDYSRALFVSIRVELPQATKMTDEQIQLLKCSLERDEVYVPTHWTILSRELA